MADVFSSDKYFWCTKDRLGAGATGHVFVGYNKVCLSGVICFLFFPEYTGNFVRQRSALCVGASHIVGAQVLITRTRCV